MNVKAIIGRALYLSIGKKLPGSFSKINIGQKWIRNKLARCFAPGIVKTVNIENGATFSSRVTAGENSNIGIRAYIQGKTIIGKNVMMGPDCIIYTYNHETSRIDIPMCEQGFREEKEVIIGDDVWIGARVIILPGVHIGNGTIIGAGAVVAKDVPSYSVAVGNPATVVKKRNN